MAFIPATTEQRVGMCVPIVGLYYILQHAGTQHDAAGSGKQGLFELFEKVCSNNPVDNASISFEKKQEIVAEYRKYTSCLVAHGLLSIIGAVAIAILGGTITATVVGLYGLAMLCSGTILLYSTIDYPNQYLY